MPLHEYQKRAAEHVVANPESALFLEVGLGKTAATLTALEEMIASGQVMSALVVAPKRVAEHVWAAERDLWAPELSMTVIDGTPKQRLGKVIDGSQVHVISRDNLVWLIETFEKKWPFDCLIVDESQGFKNSGSKRFRALKRVIKHHTRTVILSATPASENMLGLWSQVYICDQGRRLGKSFTAYRQAFFEADYMGWNWNIRPGGNEKIYARIEDMVIAMKAADYLELPERLDNPIRVTMSRAEKDAYEALERDYLLPVKDEVITAANAAVLAGKLQQLASGAVYVSEAGDVGGVGEGVGGGVKVGKASIRTWTALHDRKLEALEEIVEGANGQPILVFYWFQHEKERILKMGIGAEEINVDRWNRGEQKIALAHPASCGAGLNLQAGGSTICWFSLPWSLELFTQANGRLHRQGQVKTVVINMIIVDGTIDDDILQALQDKKTGQDRLIEALKRRAV